MRAPTPFEKQRGARLILEAAGRLRPRRRVGVAEYPGVPGLGRDVVGPVSLREEQAAAAAQPTAPVQPLPPDITEALAQLTQLPPPLATFAAFLQALAAGQRPTPPPLPAPLDQLAAELLQALR